MQNIITDIESLGDWTYYLQQEFEKPYFKKLTNFLNRQINTNKQILPKNNNYLRALKLTNLANTKIVIIGQDPYPKSECANGLCFSVDNGVSLPGSLKNIFLALKNDLGIINHNGDLTQWAEQGVLLLNSVLTVEEGKISAHKNQGWELFSDKIITIINNQKDSVVFMLWGAYGKQKQQLINANKHLILTSSHPSPLSAYRGFLTCKHFSCANKYLKEHNIKEVIWQIN